MSSANAATRAHLHLIRQFLDHAENLIGNETGMVVCWHEYSDDETLTSDCVQCAVQHAQDALSDLGLALRVNERVS